jgi:hypothetical protein
VRTLSDEGHSRHNRSVVSNLTRRRNALLALIDDILDLFRIQADKHTLETKDFAATMHRLAFLLGAALAVERGASVGALPANRSANGEKNHTRDIAARLRP